MSFHDDFRRTRRGASAGQRAIQLLRRVAEREAMSVGRDADDVLSVKALDESGHGSRLQHGDVIELRFGMAVGHHGKACYVADALDSILLVTFAERSRHAHRSAIEAAEDGAASRLRAILMTASAMTLGMVPVAIGFGEGGPQTAPLGRAVIGGLIVATFATLTILPSIYAILQQRAGVTSPSLNPSDPASRYYEAS